MYLHNVSMHAILHTLTDMYANQLICSHAKRQIRARPGYHVCAYSCLGSSTVSIRDSETSDTVGVVVSLRLRMIRKCNHEENSNTD